MCFGATSIRCPDSLRFLVPVTDGWGGWGSHSQLLRTWGPDKRARQKQLRAEYVYSSLRHRLLTPQPKPPPPFIHCPCFPGVSVSRMEAVSGNGLICFTNCLLPQEDGSMVERDLWIDERRGVILDAQVSTSSFDENAQRGSLTLPCYSPGLAGLDMVARRIVETGVTSYV